MSAIVPHPADAEAEIAAGLPSRFAGSAFAPVRSPDGAQRNPGAAQAACTAPDFASLHPGYGNTMVCVATSFTFQLTLAAESDTARLSSRQGASHGSSKII